MSRLVRNFLLVVGVVFLLPVGVSFALWETTPDRPLSWREADWSSSAVLPSPNADSDAVVHFMAAKTGRWKGAFSVHSWVVVKERGANSYERYEVVGWGNPVRKNAYAADARWYSNKPEVLFSIHGSEASRIIPKIRSVIAAYPFAKRGDYTIWPGPNSNTFVAHILNELPEIGRVLPANSVGRDYLGQGKWFVVDPDGRNIQVSLAGYAGFAIGKRSGFEFNLLGLVAGFDPMRGTVKLPGIGTVSLK